MKQIMEYLTIRILTAIIIGLTIILLLTAGGLSFYNWRLKSKIVQEQKNENTRLWAEDLLTPKLNQIVLNSKGQPAEKQTVSLQDKNLTTVVYMANGWDCSVTIEDEKTLCQLFLKRHPGSGIFRLDEIYTTRKTVGGKDYDPFLWRNADRGTNNNDSAVAIIKLAAKQLKKF